VTFSQYLTSDTEMRWDDVKRPGRDLKLTVVKKRLWFHKHF